MCGKCEAHCNCTEKTINRLKKKIDDRIQTSGVDVEEEIGSDLVPMMKTHSKDV